jgi:hypothetical protein
VSVKGWYPNTRSVENVVAGGIESDPVGGVGCLSSRIKACVQLVVV